MPNYARDQHFIVDNNEATEYRLHRNLNEEILINNIMRTNNIFT